MSRNFIPAVLAIGMGIATGYYTFQPALKDLQSEKSNTLQLQPESQSQSQHAEQGPNQNRNVAPSSSPKEAGIGR